MYKLITHSFGQSLVKSESDGVIMSIPFCTENTDYQAYLKWLEAGNTVLPPDEPVND